MKKLLFVFVLGAFAACGSGENAATGPDTTSAAYKDSVAKAAAAMVDTTKAAVDTLAAKVDSAVKK